MTTSAASIAQGYRACPVENCPCPYHRIRHPELDDFATASATLQAFGTLRKMNEQPTPGEDASMLPSALRDIYSTLTELETTRSNITSRIVACREAALRLEKFIDEHRHFLFPIRRLPMELLVEIFSHVVEEGLFEPTEQAILPDELRIQYFTSLVPLALTCRRWNSVVLGTPSLWSHINIDLCEHNIPDDRAEFPEYHGRLSRHFMHATSENIPLTISIGTCTAAGHDYDLFPAEILLKSYASRITHLTLFLPPKALKSMNDIALEYHFTSLIHVTLANTAPGATEDQVFVAFGQSRTLRALNAINFNKINEVHIPIGIQHLSLRHHSIPRNMASQMLEDNSYGVSEQVRTLTRLKDLETLCIDLGGNEDRLHGARLLMPKLRQLTVTSHKDKSLYVLLRCITAPSLQSLTLSSLVGRARNYFHSIGSMVRRFACPLTSLEVTFRAEGPVAYIMDTLYQLPKLQHLTIRRRAKPGGARLFVDKDFEKEGQIMLPALQTLVLDAAPFMTDSLLGLADWIEARAESAPLKKVAIVSRVPNPTGSDVSDSLDMRLFRERLERLDGLEVRAEILTT